MMRACSRRLAMRTAFVLHQYTLEAEETANGNGGQPKHVGSVAE